MILLSLQTTAKFILALLLAIFGYIPFDHVNPAFQKNEELPADSTLFVLTDNPQDQKDLSPFVYTDSLYFQFHRVNEIQQQTLSITRISSIDDQTLSGDDCIVTLGEAICSYEVSTPELTEIIILDEFVSVTKNISHNVSGKSMYEVSELKDEVIVLTCTSLN